MHSQFNYTLTRAAISAVRIASKGAVAVSAEVYQMKPAVGLAAGTLRAQLGH